MRRQRGLGLIQVAIIMAALAALAMAAIFSMRYERNLFGEAVSKLTGRPALPPSGAAGTASAAVAPAAPAGVLRKCIIDGKTVLSDVDCHADNPTSERVRVHATRGIESPKARAPDPADAPAPSAQDKLIEKATR